MIFSRFFDFETVGEIELDQAAEINIRELALCIAELDNASLTTGDFLRILFVLEEDGTFGKASLLVNTVLHIIVNAGTCVKVGNLLESGILVGFNGCKSRAECSFRLDTGEHGMDEFPCHAVLIDGTPLFHKDLRILFQISRFLFICGASCLFLIATLESHQDNDESDEDDNVNHDENLHFLFIHIIPFKKRRFKNNLKFNLKKTSKFKVKIENLGAYFLYSSCMSEDIHKLPSQIIYNNLKEMMRAKNTAHESIFKFHWKKMWPFSLIWPQVDFIRIVRLMGELRKNVSTQKNLVKEAKSKAKPYEKTFLDTVPAYLDGLDTSCKSLADVAQWKQDMLEKKLHHDVKMMRDVSEYNQILKAYEKAQKDLVQAGAFVRAGWVEALQGFMNETEGEACKQ